MHMDFGYLIATQQGLWNPMATAPRDRWILLIGGRPDRHHDMHWGLEWGAPMVPPLVVARWEAGASGDAGGGSEGAEGLPSGWRYTSYDSGFYGMWEDPTYWAELPEHPSRVVC